MDVAGAGFEELRELCTAAGDKASLAIGMAELVIDHAYHDRIREAAELASEAMALTESIGDPNLTVGLSVPVIYAKTESAEHSDVLRWSQRVIDLADGDPSKGDLLIGSPLAFAYASRAIARYCLGRPGWRRRPAARPGHGPQRRPVVLRRDRRPQLLRGNTEWRAEARRFRRARDRGGPSGLPNDPVMTSRWPTPGRRWAWRWCTATRMRERDRGQKLLAEVGDVFVRRGHNLADLPIVNVYLARERARRGDRDEAIPLMRAAVDHLFREGRLLLWGIACDGCSGGDTAGSWGRG